MSFLSKIFEKGNNEYDTREKWTLTANKEATSISYDVIDCGDEQAIMHESVEIPASMLKEIADFLLQAQKLTASEAQEIAKE